MTERFKPRVAVGAILRRGDTVLLQRRHGTGWMDGWYSLPSGHIDGNESLRQAVVRELQEETHLEIQPEHIEFAYLLHRIGPGDTIEYLDVFFEITHWTGEPVIGEIDKADELLWATIDALPEQTLAYTRQPLEAIARGEQYGESGWDER